MKMIVRFLSLICILILSVIFCVGCSQNNIAYLPNPWVDCQDNLKQAAKVAGFKFPLILSNYQVRAMKDMIEITFPLDEFRDVTVRKSEKGGDISGVYNKYPINKEIMIKDCVPMQIRGNKDKIYVMNMSASSGYYSAYCEKGLSLREVEGIYEIIAEVEAPKIEEN